jgi:hypothetical protein
MLTLTLKNRLKICLLGLFRIFKSMFGAIASHKPRIFKLFSKSANANLRLVFHILELKETLRNMTKYDLAIKILKAMCYMAKKHIFLLEILSSRQYFSDIALIVVRQLIFGSISGFPSILHI